ncbi:DUF4252 domain-containing protein [Christiangramia forsetii]|uniref:DUF4252 domain-containing protein n=2 Tax=Christiangramia forsetii TaxID=411153 RepID=A0M0B9_CHRFK|nr:DUF4252 domain-containing protein [Christiangramia forsetii]GGG41299.1 hypothetical protein GCM10011532_26290 [Christiangramia forsetii]CAL66064.1 conserved hypothetical protein, secreted [Christiangramia forsetii KT0803]
MNRLVITLLLAIAPMLSQSQNFDKYEDMKEVDAMVMTSKMFKMLAKVDLSENDPEAREYMKLIENLDRIQIYKSSNANIMSQMETDVKSYLQKGSLEELMRVNDNGQNIKFYSLPGKNDNYVRELFMFLEGSENDKPMTVILSITGEIDLSQLSKLTSDLKVPGAEQLKKANKKS